MYYSYYHFYYPYNFVRSDGEEPLSFGTKYIVESGDQLYEIAERFHTSVDKLKQLNKLSSTTLYPDQILVVDDKFTPGKADEIYKDYIVKGEDSIYSIAYLFNMTVFELRNLNNLLNDEVTPGMVLTVKNIPEKVSRKIFHVVKPGDNLYSIASKYRKTVKDIWKINDLNSDKLQIDQKIIVLDGEEDNNTTYTVKPGDSLYSIALEKNISVEEIKKLNNMKSNLLTVGEQLVISS